MIDIGLGIIILLLTYLNFKFARRINRDINTLFTTVNNLNVKFKGFSDKQPAIGELFHNDVWKPFKKVDEQHGTHFKILGRWYQRKEIIFYSSVYDDLKSEVENEIR